MTGRKRLGLIQFAGGAALLLTTSFASTSDSYPPPAYYSPPPQYAPPTQHPRQNPGHDYRYGLQQELFRLQGELQRMHFEREGLLNDLQHARRQIAQLHEHVAWLDEQNRQQLAVQDTLQQQLAAANAGYENEWRRAEYLKQQGSEQQQARIQQLEQERQQLRQALQEREQRIASLSAQLNTAQKDPAPRQPSRTTAPQPSDSQQLALDQLAACVAAASDTQQMAISDCDFNQAMRIEGIRFEYDSHELTEDSREVLQQVAEILKDRPAVKLEVAGHTDTQGHPAYNIWLSQLRAEAVRDYLIEQGVTAGRLVAKGYGGDQPIADNNTWHGLHQNRRVEFRFIDHAGQTSDS